MGLAARGPAGAGSACRGGDVLPSRSCGSCTGSAFVKLGHCYSGTLPLALLQVKLLGTGLRRSLRVIKSGRKQSGPENIRQQGSISWQIFLEKAWDARHFGVCLGHVQMAGEEPGSCSESGPSGSLQLTWGWGKAGTQVSSPTAQPAPFFWPPPYLFLLSLFSLFRGGSRQWGIKKKKQKNF